MTTDYVSADGLVKRMYRVEGIQWIDSSFNLIGSFDMLVVYELTDYYLEN